MWARAWLLLVCVQGVSAQGQSARPIAIPDNSGGAHSGPAVKGVRRLLEDGESALSEQSRRLLEEVRREKPHLEGKANKALSDYERAVKALKRWLKDNIEGKTPGQIGQELYNELKRKSQEIRDLEESLKDLLGEADVKAMIERLRRDPKQFVNEEWDTLVRKLKDRDPETVRQLESYADKYRNQLREFERLKAGIQGKPIDQTVKQALTELRTKSESLQKLEGNIQALIRDSEAIKKIVEEEIRNRNIQGKLNDALDDVKNLRKVELKNLEGELGRIGRTLERDFNDVRRILERIR